MLYGDGLGALDDYLIGGAYVLVARGRRRLALRARPARRDRGAVDGSGDRGTGLVGVGARSRPCDLEPQGVRGPRAEAPHRIPRDLAAARSGPLDRAGRADRRDRAQRRRQDDADEDPLRHHRAQRRARARARPDHARARPRRGPTPRPDRAREHRAARRAAGSRPAGTARPRRRRSRSGPSSPTTSTARCASTRRAWRPGSPSPSSPTTSPTCCCSTRSSPSATPSSRSARASASSTCFATGSTVVLVSHDLETIEEWSDRVLWLDAGRVAGLGDPSEVVTRYSQVATHTA